MIEAGSKAPDFSSVDSDGKPISLSQFSGKVVVLYFYPRANTPGCTREGISFRDNIKWFADHGVVALGVSTDSPSAQKKFKDKYSLNFTMVSDKDKAISKAYGVLSPKGTALRTTFLIGRDGNVAHVFTKVRPDGHAQEVIHKISELGLTS
ncbi:peroxiredoxin [Tardisphaera miroshnichenkoae]